MVTVTEDKPELQIEIIKNDKEYLEKERQRQFVINEQLIKKLKQRKKPKSKLN